MDLQYLLFLQELREATGDALTPFFWFISEMVVSPSIMLAVVVFYWVFNKSAGCWVIMNMGIAGWLNGIAKLTACVYRPWIRDAAIHPVQVALSSATGYSFPSGHSTCAAIYYGSAAVFCRKNKKKLLAGLFFLLGLLTIFSRNYLGVHTPQDVLFGFGIAMLIVIGNMRLYRWMEAGDAQQDLKVLLGGLVIMAISMVYISVKPYPLDYVDGALLVDPEKMKPDTIKGIATMVAILLGWFIEKRFINFHNPVEKGKGLVIALIGFIPIYLWAAYFPAWVGGVMDVVMAKSLARAVPFLYMFTVVPLAMKKLTTPKRNIEKF